MTAETTAAATLADASLDTSRIRPRRGMFRTALRSTSGAVGAIIVATVVLLGLLAPLIAPHDPLQQRSGFDLTHPRSGYWLGTDEVGRDVLSRLLYGIREDLVIIAIGVALGSLIGVTLGLMSSLNRLTDGIIQRILDAVFAFPGLMLGALLTAFLGPGPRTVIVVMVVSSVPIFGRLTRTAVVSQLSNDYVAAARTVGVRPPRLLLRHVLPNSIDAVIVQVALACGHAAFLEGGLSLAGFGIPQPTPSLGNILDGALPYLSSQPWYAIGPMIVIFGLVIGSNLLADALNKGLRSG